MLRMSGKCPPFTSLKQTKPLPWNHSLCRNFINPSIIFYSLIWELRISGVLCSTLIKYTLLYKVYHYYCTACISSLQSSSFSSPKKSLYQDLLFSLSDKGSGGSWGLFHRTAVISFPFQHFKSPLLVTLLKNSPQLQGLKPLSHSDTHFMRLHRGSLWCAI